MKASQIIKVLKTIAGIFLLLVSVFGGLKLLLTSEFIQFSEYPRIVFTTSVFSPLVTFVVAAVVAAFLVPRSFQVYLLFIAAFSAWFQFGCFYWTPLMMAVAAALALTVLRSRWIRWAWLLPAVSFAALAVDAYAFHHRFAVVAHSLHTLSPDTDPKIIRSPSGKTTVYLVTGGVMGVFYYVCISSNQLLPESRVIDSDDIGEPKSEDMIVRWDSPFFFAGEKFVSLAYDERSGKITDRASYPLGGVKAYDEEYTRHIKTPEAFAQYLQSLVLKN